MRRRRRKSIFPYCAILACTLLVTLVVPGFAVEVDLPEGARVVAIGDIHGSYDSLAAALRASDLVDDELRWAGGQNVLVQTGDLTDRGTEVKEVFDLMRRLEREAAAAGGRVVTLFGNHEFYNLVGIVSTDSTPPEDLAQLVGKFAGRKAEKRQKDLLRRYRAWQKRYPGCEANSDAEWLEAHPPGFEEYLEAISPRGEYGRWLRTFDVVVRVGDTLFVHGGLSPALAEMGFDSLESINQRVTDELALYESGREWLERNGVTLPGLGIGATVCALETEIFQRTGDEEDLGESGGASGDETLDALRYAQKTLPSSGWLANHPNGPLWFRGYAFWSEEEGEEALPSVLERFGARHVVVGHTPQPGTITVRFGGKAFLIDTAMVFGEAAGGAPAALEIDDGKFSAVYVDRREPLWDPAAGTVEADSAAEETSWLGPDGRPLMLHSLAEVEGFLRTATIVGNEPIPLGVTKPRLLELERDGVRARAAFRHHHEEAQRKDLETQTVIQFRDSWENEILAYELSTLLGMGRVPPTVERAVDGQDGSVQLWIEEAMMECDRRERGVEPPDRVRFQRLIDDMHVFDNLIGNFDRNQGNILIDPEWNVWLIDHSRAFRPFRKLERPEKVLRCSRDLWSGLANLNKSNLEERLGGYLRTGDVKAVLERRDRIIARLRERIAAHGEERVIFDWGASDPYVEASDEPDVPTEAEVEEDSGAPDRPRGRSVTL